MLDTVLAFQLTIAWAGEGRCEPKRLGWWQTDVIDPAGGGDLFARLLPKTHAWASLEAAREAARRTDADARKALANPDRLRTLYFLGFELDELLADRLGNHKRQGTATSQLPWPVAITERFDADRLARALGPASAPHQVVPGGRQLKGTVPSDPTELVKSLAAALVPFAERYPMPFYRLDG